MTRALPRFSRITGDDLANQCLDLHYPKWDTVGREESSIRDDILMESGVFVLDELRLADLPALRDPEVEISQDKVARFRELIRKNGVDSVPFPVMRADGTPIDGWHRSIALLEEGVQSYRFWLPLDV